MAEAVLHIDVSLTPCVGMAQGLVYQFAQGDWEAGTLEGVAIREAAFELFIEPHLRIAWPDWLPEARYGVSDLPPSSRNRLMELLRTEADRVRGLNRAGAPLAGLLDGLAGWLAECSPEDPVRLLGI